MNLEEASNEPILTRSPNFTTGDDDDHDADADADDFEWSLLDPIVVNLKQPKPTTSKPFTFTAKLSNLESRKIRANKYIKEFMHVEDIKRICYAHLLRDAKFRNPAKEAGRIINDDY